MCHSQKKEKRKLEGARSASRASGSLWSHGRRLEVGGVAAGPSIDWTPPLPSCVVTDKLLVSLFLFHLL